MAHEPIYSISMLSTKSYDWSIHVRVIRKWRNVSKDDQPVKGFNVLLLDDKESTIQAFVGESCYLKYLDVLLVGKVFIISNFTVKPVTNRDKNRVSHNDKQIFFTSYTNVEDVDDQPSLIPINYFDFYDIGDLHDRQRQDVFLTDVIGVVEDYQPIRRWTSKKDSATKKSIVKFSLSDGSMSVRVTLWDEFAQSFNSILSEEMDQPYIVIVAAARIILSRDVLEVATCRPTLLFVNYNHPTVHQLRTMVQSLPMFRQRTCRNHRSYKYHSHTIDELLHLGKDSVGKKVLLLLTLTKIAPGNSWFFYECTSCFEELTLEGDNFFCPVCCRVVEYPDRKFQVLTMCTDDTGTIALVLGDREVRRLTMHTAISICSNSSTVPVDSPYPKELLNLEGISIRALLNMTAENTAEGCNVFTATEVIVGHFDVDLSYQSITNQSTMSELSSPFTQGTTSTCDYHLDSITQLHLQTPSTSGHRGKGKY